MYRAMVNNESEYPDPSSFKPERYLKNGQLDPNIRDPALMAFGFGRRYVVLRAKDCLFITYFLRY
jgi:cytochrome P450